MAPKSSPAVASTFTALCAAAHGGHSGQQPGADFLPALEAELVAIGGYYRTAVNLDANLRDRPVQGLVAGVMIAAMD